MSGISSKAAGLLENKKKYNGIEFDNDLDINTYEANLRDLDPQTGRWWQIDPLTDKMEMWSPYVSNYDNPIRYSDPLGDEPDGDCCGGLWNTITNGVKAVYNELSYRASTHWEEQKQWVKSTASTLASNAKANWASGNTIIQQLPKDFLENPIEFLEVGAEIDLLKGVGIEFKPTLRGLANEDKIIKELKLTKNTETHTVIDPKTSKPINVKHDAFDKTTNYEIKDTKKLSNTRQIRGEREVAKQQGKDFKIITGEQTKASKNIPKHEIIKRKDIGPQ